MVRANLYFQAELLVSLYPTYNLTIGSLRYPRGDITHWTNQVNRLEQQIRRIRRRRRRRGRRIERRARRRRGRVFEELRTRNERIRLDNFFRNPRHNERINIVRLSLRDALNRISLDRLNRYILILRIGDISNLIINENQIKKMLNFMNWNILALQKIDGSDPEQILEVLQNPNVNIRFEIYEKGRVRVESAFFPYTHTLDKINLEKFGIYNKIPEKYDNNCLVQSLIALDLPIEKINKIKTLVKKQKDETYVPMKDLRMIAEKLGIYISLNKIEKNGTVRKIPKNKKAGGKVYNIATRENHYFAILPTEYTKYSIEHYHEINHLKDFNRIRRKIKGKYYDKSKKHFKNSLAIITILLKNKDTHLEKISKNTKGIIKTKFYDEVDDFTDLTPNLPHDFKEVGNYDLKELKEGTKIIYFDFEARTDEDIHKAYQIWYSTRENEERKEVEEWKYFEGENCGLDFLKSISKYGNCLCIAHNLRYDIQFIIKYLSPIKKLIKTGNKIKCLDCEFYYKSHRRKTKIKFKDSYSIISMPLRKFPECFDLKSYKDVMPYELFTKDTVKLKSVPIKDALKYISNEDKKLFLKNIEKWGLKVGDDRFKHIEYSKIYCKKDVKILQDGYEIFRGWMLKVANIDVDLVISIPQLSNKFGLDKNCFDGIYKISGIAREFIQRCVEGGRVMTRNNEKIYAKYNKNIKEKTYFDKGLKKEVENYKIQDFDAVSLYPSAMNRMKGFLKGVPKVINKSWNNKRIMNQDGYFVEIEIKKVNKKLQFPLISFKNDKDIREYTNKPRKMYVDKTKLEDLIKYQEIEFEIIRGYYFNEGWNTTINEVMEKLFIERLRKKKEGNPIQEVYKLIMNSFYGKLIMRAIDKKYSFVYGKKNFNKFLSYHYNTIKNYINITEGMVIFEEFKPTSEHFSMPHCGVEVLSMSKRIVNEVMCLSEELGVEMFYTDTDSIHIDENGIDLLDKEYKKRYEREIIGKNMGQFHCDFDDKIYDKDGKKIGKYKYVVAIESIFLAKKCYIDKLEKTKNNGDIDYDNHTRMKSIPNKCIIKHKSGKKSLEIYGDLYDGEKYTFDLLKAVKFKCNKNFTMSNQRKFERTIKF